MAIKKEQIQKMQKNPVNTYDEERQRQPEPEREKKQPISFYITPSNYADIKRLAHYRAMSAGSLIDEVLGAYLEEHRDELTAYDEFTKKMQAKNKK